MPDKLGLILIFALVQVSLGNLRREWVPSSMTAAEMWNPATWYYPYGIAAAESWATYLKNSQQATNQLYQQWHATGAQWGGYQGWWSGGQSTLVPGGGTGGVGGANDTAQGALGQAQGAAGQIPQTTRPNQGAAGGTSQSAGPNQRPNAQYMPIRQ